MFVALSLSRSPAAALPAFQSPQEISVVGIPGGAGLGEVWRYTAEGRLASRWTGLADIGSVFATGAGRLAVFQQGNRRLVEFDESGIVHRVLSLPFTNVFRGTVLSDGHLLMAVGKDGTVELDGAGDVVWRLPPPEPAAEVVAAVRLADGTTLCAVKGASGTLYEAVRGSPRLTPLRIEGVGPSRDQWLLPGLRLLDSAAHRVALWCESWRDWYRLDWRQGSVEGRSVFPAKAGVRAIAPGRGAVTWVAETPFEDIRLSPSGAETGRLAIAEEIRDIAGGGDGGVFVAVERTLDAERPAHRPPPPGHQPFSWIGLASWVLCSFLFVGFLQVMTWRNAARAAPQPSSRADQSSAPSTGVVQPQERRRITLATAAVVGLVMAGVGSARQRDPGATHAILFLVAGALLAAIAGQWWSRGIRREVDQWWVRTQAARFPAGLLLATCSTVAALLAGGFVLWRWRSAGSHPDGSVSLWVFLQLLCVGLLLLSPRRPLRRARVPWEILLHVAGLFLLASVVLNVDLESVPRNVHHDVGLTVDFAMRLLEGRADGLFSSGYAEIPYPGHLPASLGLLIAGKTVAGSRWGGMLMGLVAVFGTYALGREYRSARLGLLASILLLASIPFLHFSRSTPFGEVAAYSVWLLYLLLRAVRTAHPGAWLVLGVVGGWGLFFFYSARVALVGVVVAGVLLSLRSLRVTLRRWYGPLLFSLGFAITVLPMIPYWKSHPGAFSHRMDTSFALYDPHTGFHRDVLARALGKPFLKTLGMFYTERDASGQGTMSPAAGPIEAALLSIGLAVVLADGWGANVACLGWFVMMLVGCGAFAEATPWYTRLVPVTPVVSLFMARAVDLLLDLFPLKRPRWRWVATAVIAAALIGGVVTRNLRTYLNYERAGPATEFTAFGQAARILGSRYQFSCVIFQRPDFSCMSGAFVPYLATLDVRDLRDLVRAMPFPAGRPVALLIPFARFIPHPLDPSALVNEILLRYPDAKLQLVHGNRNGSDPPLGLVVVVSPG